MSEPGLRPRCPRPSVPVAIALLCGALAPASALASLAQAAPSAPAKATGKHSSKPKKKKKQKTPAKEAPVASSPDLWATVDVCDAADQPDTIGIRGSMPAGPEPKAEMYMNFQVQYLVSASSTWTNLTPGGSSGWQKLGPATSVRQAGQTFKFVPEVSGEGAFTVRGEVEFQWRKGSMVLQTLKRTTTSGHESLAGADPAGFSSATCAIT